MTTTTAVAVGGGRNFSLTSVAVVQCGSSMTAHMYIYTLRPGPPVHVGNDEQVLFFWFCSFGFGCSAGAAVLPWFMAMMGTTTQLHHGRNWKVPVRASGGTRTLSASREMFVLVASDINIFGTLPNWQGKLFVRRPARAPRDLGAFSGPGPEAVSRRYCVKDGTGCAGGGSSSERYRSWSVSIQTVVVSQS